MKQVPSVPFPTLHQVIFCIASEMLQECKHLCNSAGPRFKSGSGDHLAQSEVSLSGDSVEMRQPQ